MFAKFQPNMVVQLARQSQINAHDMTEYCVADATASSSCCMLAISHPCLAAVACWLLCLCWWGVLLPFPHCLISHCWLSLMTLDSTAAFIPHHICVQEWEKRIENTGA
jgi:hypothetical protein